MIENLVQQRLKIKIFKTFNTLENLKRIFIENFKKRGGCFQNKQENIENLNYIEYNRLLYFHLPFYKYAFKLISLESTTIIYL